MASNTVQTIWKILLDEGEVRENENAIQRMARLIKDKLGGEGSKAVDKTTDAIEKQTKALKDAEDQAKKTADTYDVRLKRVKEGGADFSGDVASSSAGIRGAIDTFSGGNSGALGGILEFTEAIADVGEYAPAAATQIGTLVTSLGPVGIGLAAVAAVAAAAIIAASQSIQKEADRITALGESRLAVAERVAAGLSTDDALAEMEQNAKRREEIQRTLNVAQEEYNEFLAQQPDILGNAGDNLLKIFDAREAAFEKAVLDAQNKIKEIDSDDQALKEAVDDGRTITAKAAEAEQALSQSRAETASSTETAQKKQQQTQEKAASDAQRQAEQAAAKAQQIEEKRYAAAQKYGDALVDIAKKSADDATKLAQAARQKQVDNQRAFNEDIVDLSLDFHASEREETIARREEEAQSLKQHAASLASIRDEALTDETDLLRKRDFLGASLVRENANKTIERENEAFLVAQDERMAMRKSEDAAQLRELDDARRKRLTALRRANNEAQIQYRRDIEAQRDARRIAEREARTARDRELRAASDMARALLGIQAQQNQAQLQMASNTLNQLRGVTNTTHNKTVNGGINFNLTQGGGGMSMKAVQQQILTTLGTVGLA